MRNKTNSTSSSPDARKLIQQLNKHLSEEEKDYFRTEALFSFRLGAVEFYTFRQILCNLFLDKPHRTRDVTAFIERNLIEQERGDLLCYVTEFRAMNFEEVDSDEPLPLRRVRLRHSEKGSRSLTRSHDPPVPQQSGNETDDEGTSADDVINGSGEQPPAYVLDDAKAEKGYTSGRSPEQSSAEEKPSDEQVEAQINQADDDADDVTVTEEVEAAVEAQEDDATQPELTAAECDVTAVAAVEAAAVSGDAKKSKNFVSRMWRSWKGKKTEK